MVAKIEDVPEGELRAVTTVLGDEICLFNLRGTIGAVHNACTHAEFPMSDGTWKSDGTIECVWHGTQYSCLTGAVCRGPAVDPLPVYDVRVEDGKVLVGPRRK